MSERSSAWLERQLWELDVAGSNPVAPTISPHISQPGVAETKIARRATPRLLHPPRTFSYAGLGNMPCDSVAGKSTLIKPPLHAALPRLQCALVGAKRLECGSLLPLCVYAQATCLEPDRNDLQNNVSVPISRFGSAAALGRIHPAPGFYTGCDSL